MLDKKVLYLLAFWVSVILAAPAAAQVQRDRTVAWDDPDNVAGQVTEYRLYYGTRSGGPYDMGRIVIPAGTMTAKVTLPKGTYFFICTAANPDSESPPSNEASTSVYDNSNKPINLRIIVGK